MRTTEADERKTTLDAAVIGNAAPRSTAGGPASMGSKSADHKSHGKIVYQKASSSVGKRQMEVSINAAAVSPASPVQTATPPGNLFVNPPMRLQNMPNQIVAVGDYSNDESAQKKFESAAQAKMRLSSQPQSTRRRGSQDAVVV